jgi:hypothetical protein
MSTLYAIIALFGIGAILGLYLLIIVLQTKETPKAVAFIHGTFVAVALVMLAVYATKHKPGPITSLILFGIAATGGFILVYRDLSGQTIPKWLALTHGVLAISGFVFLIIYTFTDPTAG